MSLISEPRGTLPSNLCFCKTSQRFQACEDFKIITAVSARFWVFDISVLLLILQSMSKLQPWLDYLEMAKYDRICLSCWLGPIGNFLSERFGRNLDFRQSTIISCFPNLWNSTGTGLFQFMARNDHKVLQCISKDCPCEDLTCADLEKYYYKTPTNAASLKALMARQRGQRS